MAFVFIYKLSGTSQCLIFSGAALFSFLHVNRHCCVSLSGNIWLSLISSGLNHIFSARDFWNLSLMAEEGGIHCRRCSVRCSTGQASVGGIIKLGKRVHVFRNSGLFSSFFEAVFSSSVYYPVSTGRQGRREQVLA